MSIILLLVNGNFTPRMTTISIFFNKNRFTDGAICTVAMPDAILYGSNDYSKYVP